MFCWINFADYPPEFTPLATANVRKSLRSVLTARPGVGPEVTLLQIAFRELLRYPAIVTNFP